MSNNEFTKIISEMLKPNPNKDYESHEQRIANEIINGTISSSQIVSQIFAHCGAANDYELAKEKLVEICELAFGNEFRTTNEYIDAVRNLYNWFNAS